MKILGIDPGMAIVGYSLLEFDGKNIELLTSGSIQTAKGQKESARLLEILMTCQQLSKNSNRIFAQLKNYFSLEIKQQLCLLLMLEELF